MQTPISFILDLILDYELPADAQKRCRKYIRELEGSLGQKAITHPGRPINLDQAPSTQRLLEAQAAAPLPLIPPMINRVVGGEISTGPGTKGPRKF